ncbi:hypothetical protein BCD_1061 (plasmid) [Borrelia crocidurae DOU]|uniref:Uncharacterized protein n=1 Tax=Borrelia crocidurae DOU TaxID=1293575 RepID=W5SJM5_9SPIR|nr:hypothetical protein BCD_1061 [Borrelia crocidurae DOU]
MINFISIYYQFKNTNNVLHNKINIFLEDLKKPSITKLTTSSNMIYISHTIK